MELSLSRWCVRVAQRGTKQLYYARVGLKATSLWPVVLLCLFFVTACAKSETAPPAVAQQAPAPRAPESEGFVAEMNRRFLNAMRGVTAAPLEDWDEGGLIGLHYLERDFGVQAGAAQLTRKALEAGIKLPRLIRPDPRGLASAKLLEQRVDLAWLRRQVRQDVPFELTDTGLLILGSQAAVSACLASEAVYNERLLKHFDSLRWPADTEWVRYGMYLGFAMHGCIRPEAARKQTEKLVPPLVKWLARPDVPIDLKSYVFFAFAASDRLAAVPSSLLLDFVRAQRDDGTWQSGSFGVPAQNQTPLGAYVIAAMLRGAGYPLPQLDFRTSTGLPVPAPALTSVRGRETP